MRDPGSGSSMEEESAAGSGSESSDSKVAGSCRIRRAYRVGKIKQLLQRTKTMKGVKVEDYFKSKLLFSLNLSSYI